jgi:putative tricarboxylic transport membrane protein
VKPAYGYGKGDVGEAIMNRLWAAAVTLLISAGMNGVQAQDYPARTVTLIVPFAAGGPADITGRIVADILTRHLGQKFVVENVGGAGGTIGTLRAARAAADGYTLLSGHLGTNALASAFYPSLGYDPLRDFEPIGLTAEYPELLVVRKGFPANDLKEFIAYAKANESKLNVGHAGLGSVSYIGCLLLHSAIGIKPAMVPFTGTAPVLNAMLGGEIDYECDPVLGTLTHVRAGTVKALAVAARKRSPMLPDVPTSYEQGLPEFDCAPFYAVFAPSGTPKPIVERLAEALNKGLSEEAVQKRLADLGADIIEPNRRGPNALADLVSSETARLMPILKAAAAK